MQSIERIGAPVQRELVTSDAQVSTMREFLSETRVARDFQDLKADAQRLEAAVKERDALTQKAAEAELEAGRRARMHDEHRHQRLTFATGATLAALFVALDALPANLAAQTFGLDRMPTWGITAVIVGALAAGMWAVSHFKTGWRRVLTIGALTVGLLSIGALRFWFLWVTAGDPLSALLEAFALTVFTTMMVWLGVLVLSFTKSRHVSAAEHTAHRFRRRAERRQTREVELGRRYDAARSEFLADAQLFSFRSFQNDALRTQFLDYVRAELDR
ncbi:MAG TPA: hypothetical protein VJT78_05730 [Candidatus Dormibacteraeota bacterium]|nr:hypothetical protein [Candidatus Dormibacteraeota bacterium]